MLLCCMCGPLDLIPSITKEEKKSSLMTVGIRWAKGTDRQGTLVGIELRVREGHSFLSARVTHWA